MSQLSVLQPSIFITSTPSVSQSVSQSIYTHINSSHHSTHSQITCSSVEQMKFWRGGERFLNKTAATYQRQIEVHTCYRNGCIYEQQRKRWKMLEQLTVSLAQQSGERPADRQSVCTAALLHWHTSYLVGVHCGIMPLTHKLLTDVNCAHTRSSGNVTELTMTTKNWRLKQLLQHVVSCQCVSSISSFRLLSTCGDASL